MKILDHVHKAIDNVLVKTGRIWHEDIAPWLTKLLDSILHAEVEALIPLARAAVAELGEELKDAKSVKDFINVAGSIVVRTAEQARDQALETSGAAILTAVTAAIAEHPAGCHCLVHTHPQDPLTSGALIGTVLGTAAPLFPPSGPGFDPNAEPATLDALPSIDISAVVPPELGTVEYAQDAVDKALGVPDELAHQPH